MRVSLQTAVFLSKERPAREESFAFRPSIPAFIYIVLRYNFPAQPLAIISHHDILGVRAR